MPRGTINGNKIHVTGFTPSTTQEQVYRVTASGKSTAEKTLGSSVLSNEAVVVRKKLTRILLTNGGNNPECSKGGLINIETVNVKNRTLDVIQYPVFVSSYYVKDNVIHYCLYPNYSSTESGVFVVAGVDIYGKTVFSEPYDINNPGGDNEGRIDLSYGGQEQFSIPGNVQSLILTYNLYGVVPTSVEVNDYSGEITNIVIDTGETTVTLSFPANNSTVYDRTYRITVKGLNNYGETVISNQVTITHQKETSDTDFYIRGNDIGATDTTGTFKLYYPSSVIRSTIAIYDWSDDTIVGQPSIHAGSSPMDVEVTTTRNYTQSRRALVIYASARTESDRVLYATGVINQGIGSRLAIPTSPSDNIGVLDYTNFDHISAFDQVHSFKYLAFNVSSIGVVVEGAGATATINTGTKTVTVNFPKNTKEPREDRMGEKISDTRLTIPMGNGSENYDSRLLTMDKSKLVYGLDDTDTELRRLSGSEKQFVVTVTGTSNATGERLQAIYRFTQDVSTDGGFDVSSGGTSSATVGYNETEIRIRVTFPDDAEYADFMVSNNTSTSDEYGIYNVGFEVVGEELYLTGRTFVNEGYQDQTYTIQVSAKDGGNVTRYTNVFTITQGANSRNANSSQEASHAEL